MEAFIEKLIGIITEQGALGVFLASIVEEVIVPIPSTVIQTGAGFFFLSGMAVDAHSIWILFSHVIVPSALGATIGSLAIYGLVYWGEMPFVKRFGKYFFITPAKVAHAHEVVLRHKSLVWAFCILRFVPLLPSVFIAAVAGFVRLPIRTYLWTTFLGIAVRATYLGIFGWTAGSAYQSNASGTSIGAMVLWLAVGVFGATALVGGILWYVRKKKHRRV